MSNEYAGLRCVGLVRTSTRGQTENGITQQLEVCRRFAESKNMIWVDAEHAPGVSAYQTEDRDDINRILDRRRRGEDFQIVVVHDYSRLTRGGVDHGSFLLWQFTQVGLRVVSATNDIPENEYAPLLRAIEFMRDKGYSESTAKNTARGRMAAILDGRSTHCGQPPFGVDRLYMTAKGEKLFRLRNLPDGSQVKLPPDLDSEDEIEKFEPNTKMDDGSVQIRHYKKQPHERVTLVPGDPQAMETIRYILRRFFVDGIGSPTITLEVNTKGWPSHDGGIWNISSVFDVIYQPVYVGRGICNFINEAKIYNRARNQPRRVHAAVRKLTYRPEEEWEIVEYPELQGPRGFVPPELQPVVWERQRQRYRDRASGVNRRTEIDSRIQSSYFLKGSIYTVEGHRMRGHQSTPSPNHRYYAWTHNVETPTHGTRERKHLFPAKPVEEAVKNAIGTVFANLDPNLDAIREYVDRRLKMAFHDNADLAGLIAERKRVAEELIFSTNELTVLGPELLKKKIEPLKLKLKGLDARVENVKRSARGVVGSTDEIVAAVADELRAVSKHLDDPSSPAFRRVVSLLTRTVVDLDQRVAEIEVRVPVEVLNDPKMFVDREMCLGSPPLPTLGITTHDQNGVLLFKTRCKLRKRGRKPCFDCERLPLAA